MALALLARAAQEACLSPAGKHGVQRLLRGLQASCCAASAPQDHRQQLHTPSLCAAAAAAAAPAAVLHSGALWQSKPGALWLARQLSKAAGPADPGSDGKGSEPSSSDPGADGKASGAVHPDGPVAGSGPATGTWGDHHTDFEPQDLLQRVNVLQFRRELEVSTEDNAVITYAELLDKCQASGAAASRQEAEVVCKALLAASVVMRLGDLVYLRPYDVAELIAQALPGTEVKVREKLQRVHAALDPLDSEKSRMDRGANRLVRAILWAGLAGFIVQWSFFLRLTFWELSWDVMEPVTYFVSSGVSIVIYVYFLWTDSEFSYKPWRTRLAAKLQANRYAAKGFDLDRYQMLQQDARRLERLLRRLD